MTEATTGSNVATTQTTEPAKVTEAATSAVLSGAEKQLDGNTHVGIAVMVASDKQPSTLMIPDVGGIGSGEPVYIIKPIRINGANLKTFMANKGVTLPDSISNLIEDTKISCEAFYYSTGPMLMMFALKFETGLIASLTGDEDLGALFDIKGASVRVLKCPKDSYDVLKQYVAELEA